MQMMSRYIKNANAEIEPTDQENQNFPNNEKSTIQTSQVTNKTNLEETKLGLTSAEIEHTRWLFETITEEL